MTTVFKDARKRAYLNAEGADKPLRSPVPIETRARGAPIQRFQRAAVRTPAAQDREPPSVPA